MFTLHRIKGGRQCFVQEDTHDRKVLIAIYPTHGKDQVAYPTRYMFGTELKCILSKLLGTRKISTFWHPRNFLVQIIPGKVWNPKKTFQQAVSVFYKVFPWLGNYKSSSKIHSS